MNQILSFGYSICVSLIVFGFAGFLGNDRKYRSLIKMICGLLFMLVVINGIQGVNTDIHDIGNILFIDSSESDINPTEESLQYQIKMFLNNQLSQNGFVGATCSAVTLESEQQSYQLNSIYLRYDGDETDKLILYINKLTGVSQEHIFVE